MEATSMTHPRGSYSHTQVQGAYLSTMPVRPCTHITLHCSSISCDENLSVSTFQSIFDTASKEYQKKTGRNLRTHPLAAEFDHCNSPNAVLDIFQKQADALDRAGKSNQMLLKWLNPTVHLLYMFSATIAEGASLVSLTKCILCVSVFPKTFDPQTFSPAKVIFTGIGVLLTVIIFCVSFHLF